MCKDNFSEMRVIKFYETWKIIVVLIEVALISQCQVHYNKLY